MFFCIQFGKLLTKSNILYLKKIESRIVTGPNKIIGKSTKSRAGSDCAINTVYKPQKSLDFYNQKDTTNNFNSIYAEKEFVIENTNLDSAVVLTLKISYNKNHELNTFLNNKITKYQEERLTE
ncbi:hypothetical protein BpHYR1_038959 [Brachionus plicatilis]|uniref:Uncharacterized protein n=1 Tax=Brachionus plicatilis TaxID=10195 RepID=A0A3M7R8X7_BRAPC|nr:hypothetical protein BpHYR1_038959 [Brachionus plicatilis]